MRPASKRRSRSPTHVRRTVRHVAEDGDGIEGRLAGRSAIREVLEAILGSEDGKHLVAVHRLRNRHSDGLPNAAPREGGAPEELLESLAVVRLGLEPVSPHLDVAVRAWQLVSTGLVDRRVWLVPGHRSDSPTWSPGFIPVAESFPLGVVATLASFVSCRFLAATVALGTVSVGPFVPPSERRWAGASATERSAGSRRCRPQRVTGAGVRQLTSASR